MHTICGMLMHSSLAVTLEGLPLGLTAIKFWTRKKFKGCNALKKRINPTRVPIEKKESIRWLENLRQSTLLFNEPDRCVHIGDRESDMYELFCEAHELKTHFLIRTCVDRLAGEDKHTVADEMNEVSVKGLHCIEVRNAKGEISTARLEIKYRRIRVLPPTGKQCRYPALTLTVIRADEQGPPDNRKPIHWQLITDIPVSSRRSAIEKLTWYALRWKIETFHKILKSGCKAEDAKLRTAARLVNLIAVYCILSWRIFWMTMLNRSIPDISPTLVFTSDEMVLLDPLIKDKDDQRRQQKTLSSYLTTAAQLGGYLARARDSPPGNHVLWRGMSRLIDIESGFAIGAKLWVIESVAGRLQY